MLLHRHLCSCTHTKKHSPVFAVLWLQDVHKTKVLIVAEVGRDLWNGWIGRLIMESLFFFTPAEWLPAAFCTAPSQFILLLSLQEDLLALPENRANPTVLLQSASEDSDHNNTRSQVKWRMNLRSISVLLSRGRLETQLYFKNSLLHLLEDTNNSLFGPYSFIHHIANVFMLTLLHLGILQQQTFKYITVILCNIPTQKERKWYIDFKIFVHLFLKSVT